MSAVDKSVSGLFSFLAHESSPLAALPGARWFLPNRLPQAFKLRSGRETLYQGILDDYIRRRDDGETGDCIVGSILDRRDQTGMTDTMVNLSRSVVVSRADSLSSY